MTRIIYRPEAIADVASAFEWYERHRKGLGDEFLGELRAAEALIARSPGAFRVIHRDARRCFLRRFPYQLLFRVVDEDVVIVGCFHVRRSPAVGKRRNRP